MKFCCHCGSDAVVFSIPEGDDRPRHLCQGGGAVHYINPRIIVGVLPYLGDRVLLCKRAIEPRLGLWTLPAGFMENGETMAEAAMRETDEEACARVRGLQLYTLFDLPHISQLYVFFRAELIDLDFRAGEESLEVQLFHEHEIPWQELAFPTVGRTLKCYFADRQAHSFPIRNEGIAALR